MKKEFWILIFGIVVLVTGCAIGYAAYENRQEKETVFVWAVSDAVVSDYVPQEDALSDIRAEQYRKAFDKALEKYISDMTLEEKLGQMFFIRATGGLDREDVEKYHPGGIILFGIDVDGKTKESLRETLREYQGYSKCPLLIGSDEEGGTVTRVSNNANLTDETFKSPKSLYKQGGYDAIEQDAHKKSQILLDLGINVNFAPVCDAAFDAEDFMYKRSFGENIEETCIYAGLVTAAMKEEKIGSVLKHFPGYGNNGDTHTNIVIDERSYETFQTQDFLPFQAGIASGADCVMVCHNIVNCMDKNWPASLSENVHYILREKLGFSGVIITDDLSMDGVSDYVSDEESVVRAIQAGNDMVLVSDCDVQYKAALEAIKSGAIKEDQIALSVRRILCWKINLGLLHFDEKEEQILPE